MGNKILFSPVGSNDPISKGHDGSLLHICRNEKPDKVILYLSGEMNEYHEKDNRYVDSLDRLSNLINWNKEIEIMRATKDTVSDYNFFYKEFMDILQDQISKMSKDDELLLNVSSGTPQMKSALLTINTIGELPCRALQVNTPEKTSNAKEWLLLYKKKEEWERNIDNNDDFESRLEQVKCPELLKLKYEEIIKGQINNYDYDAAYDIAKKIASEASQDYIKLIELMYYRSNLKLKDAKELCKNNQLPYMNNTKYLDVYEYALYLKRKLKRKEILDFCRGFSPLFLEILKILIIENEGIDIHKHIQGPCWNIKTLKRDKTCKKIVDVIYSNSTISENISKNPIISSNDLVDIIKKTANCFKYIVDVNFLRDFERKIRNKAAHQIAYIDDAYVKKETGFTCKDILSKVEKIMDELGYVDKDYWNSYDNINLNINNEISKRR